MMARTQQYRQLNIVCRPTKGTEENGEHRHETGPRNTPHENHAAQPKGECLQLR